MTRTFILASATIVSSLAMLAPAHAAMDGITRLISVTQMKANNANEQRVERKTINVPQRPTIANGSSRRR